MKTRKFSNKRVQLTVLILTIVMAMLTIGFAWYVFLIKHTDTKSLQIMTPYTLYLLNSGATDTLELSVGGIHPKETKQIVVCVSSHDAGADGTVTSKKGVFPYTLELIHTDNIGLTYNVYPLTSLSAKPENIDDDIVVSEYQVTEGNVQSVKTAYFEKGTVLTGDTSKSTEYQTQMYGADNLSSIVNKGTYCIFSEDEFELSLSDKDKRYNYFLVEIQWDVDKTDEKSKETDLVYLVAKAGVPKPVED